MLTLEASKYFDQISPKEAGGIMRMLKDLIEYQTKTDDPWIWSQMLNNAETKAEELIDFLSLAQDVTDDEKEDSE